MFIIFFFTLLKQTIARARARVYVYERSKVENIFIDMQGGAITLSTLNISPLFLEI